MKIRNHRLQGRGVEYIESPNQGGPYAEGDLDTIIIHYTDGASVEDAIQTLCDTERKVSAHLVIGRDGSITQLLPFDTIGWHAGKSAWGERQGFNQYSIGFELENAGQLEEKNGRYLSWFGREYPAAEVVRAVHRNQTRPTCWHRFTPGQIRAVEGLCARLVREYGIRHILGHEEVAPGRKVDPGPACPLDELRARLLYRPVVQGGSEGVVETGRLNIRTAPQGSAERVAGFLPQGTPVRILEKSKGWYRVAVELEGWVAGRHVEAI
jgi:N-acetylmuramoyl-L-alanine amidase